MNDRFPFDRDVFIGPDVHHGGPSALTWAIFALQLLMLLGLAALLVSALAGPRAPTALRRPRAPAATPTPREPLEVLRMRYARGEISRDEYLQAVRDLGGAPPDDAPTLET